jgi:hypothetical protein
MLFKRQAIFKGLFDAFLPDVGKFVDFEHLTFIDKELVTLDGKKRTGDLLVKTRYRHQTAGFLIHIEHQAQADSNLAQRLLEYLVLDRREYKMPVNPIAILSHLQETQPAPLELSFPNKTVLHFGFDVIDQARMDAGAFVKMKNPEAPALASRMKMDPKNRVPLARDFFVSLAHTDIAREEKDLVAGFYSRYQPLSE